MSNDKKYDRGRQFEGVNSAGCNVFVALDSLFPS